MTIIITRPEHDLTTKYISSWAEDIILLAKKKSLDVIDLKRKKANKKEFVGRIKKIKPRLIFINGHGNESVVTGHDNEDLIVKNDNHHLLNGKITYALSCKSGKSLGRSVECFKESAYIGYKDDFIFMQDKDFLFNPLKDPKAKPFMEASNQVMISLLKGNSVIEASKKSIEKYQKNCNRLLTSNTDINSLMSAQFLWWNARNQVCLGDVDEVI